MTSGHELGPDARSAMVTMGTDFWANIPCLGRFGRKYVRWSLPPNRVAELFFCEMKAIVYEGTILFTLSSQPHVLSSHVRIDRKPRNVAGWLLAVSLIFHR